MRRTFVVLAVTAVLASAAASFTVLPEAPRGAAANATFLVPAEDGYGVGNCLAAGGECARLVANSWCETQGFARAVRFGPTPPEAVADLVQTVSSGGPERPVSITCTM